ncbi:MAG: hypothetical protein SGJ09_14375 [Phycisphaerae bacterium]|nr:hypothetical protein [Phycisphaerae bacterium]
MSRRGQAKCRIILSILCIHVESLHAANSGIHTDHQDQHRRHSCHTNSSEFEDIGGEVADHLEEAVGERAATFLVFEELRAPDAARDAVTSNGLGWIEYVLPRSCV